LTDGGEDHTPTADSFPVKTRGTEKSSLEFLQSFTGKAVRAEVLFGNLMHIIILTKLVIVPQ